MYSYGFGWKEGWDALKLHSELVVMFELRSEPRGSLSPFPARAYICTRGWVYIRFGWFCWLVDAGGDTLHAMSLAARFFFL